MDKECQSLKSPWEPFFAGVLSAESLDEILQNPQGEFSKAARQCSALEIRYDLLLAAGYSRESLGDIAGRVRSVFPDALLIGTFRLERDGGKFPDSRAMERAEYICEILAADVFPDYLDIEAEEFVRLESRIFEIWNDERFCEKRKGFWTMRNGHRFYRYRFELFSCFAMGKSGEESRIKSLARGANLTYCSIGISVAPGQIPVEKARKDYRKLVLQG